MLSLDYFYIQVKNKHMNQIQKLKIEQISLFNQISLSLKEHFGLFIWKGFFEPLSLLAVENNLILISVPSLFHKNWIETHYLTKFKKIAQNICKKEIEISFVEQTGFSEILPTNQATEYNLSKTITPLKSSNFLIQEHKKEFQMEAPSLNQEYSFENFVCGQSNHMSLESCKAVAKEPGNKYNPLFLFGPEGVGKTHLMHAIGLFAMHKNINNRVIYMTAEQWVNTYISTVRQKNFDLFRKKFRTECDILLIDDAHFLAGKNASQDEFFHTINSLHQANKQIVISANKYPHEIIGLEKRLQARFSWGLIADIKPPDIETKIAILQRKALQNNVILSSDIIYYLASRLSNSIRELEGSLLRLAAFSNFKNSNLTISEVKELLFNVYIEPISELSPDKICEYVAIEYNLQPIELIGQSRQLPVTLARQIAIMLCRNMLQMSLAKIGQYFGNRDHTTIITSLNKINVEIKKNSGLYKTVLQLQKTLQNLYLRNSNLLS